MTPKSPDAALNDARDWLANTIKAKLTGAELLDGCDHLRFIERALSAPEINRGWRTIESAPRDGTIIIGARFGKYSDQRFLEQLWWQPEFDAFIRSCREMVMHNGYTLENGETRKLHSPEIYKPTHWMPLPPPPTKEDDNEAISPQK